MDNRFTKSPYFEIVCQPLTLYPSPLHKGRGKRILKGSEAPFNPLTKQPPSQARKYERLRL